MKTLTILLMKRMLKRAYKQREKTDCFAVKKAYGIVIKNYQDTIMYLTAQR